MSKNISKILEQCTGFDWDNGNKNKNKNWIRYKVAIQEAEQVFFNKPRVISKSIKHSQTEDRFGCYGQTNENRKLFIAFTIRSNKVRIVSTRDQDKKERRKYAEQIKKIT